MSAEEHKALLRRYLDEVWNGADPDAAAQFLDPAFRRYTTARGEPLDARGQIARLHSFRTAFPDAQLHLAEVVAEGDVVVFRSTMTGTHRGEFFGIPPTGNRVAVALLDMIRVRDGRFVEHWGGPDLFDLAGQLGAAPRV